MAPKPWWNDSTSSTVIGQLGPGPCCPADSRLRRTCGPHELASAWPERCDRQRQDHRSEAPGRLLRARKVLNATTRLVRSGAGWPSELGQLGERRQDPYLTRTKFDNQGGVVFDADDPAKPVLIVGHLVLHGKLLNRGLGGPGVEGTRRQMAPGRGAGRLHHLQYAPSRPSPLVSGLPVSPRPRHRQPGGRPRQGTDRAISPHAAGRPPAMAAAAKIMATNNTVMPVKAALVQQAARAHPTRDG